jgi:hypothetical protein
MKPEPLSAQELQRRRSNSRRLAWALGGLALLLYAIGMFIPR